MCESTSKPVVVIPTIDESEAIQEHPDRPLRILNAAGRTIIERRPLRIWDGETISLEGFQIK